VITKSGPTRYRLNLIRDLRERERRKEQRRKMMFTLGAACFGFFVLSLLYSGFTMWRMEKVLADEQLKLNRLKVEYNKYTVTKLIVDKSDVELLNQLKGRGIFWTGKLAAIAKHLPDNYWITHFKYANNELHVSGYGYVPPQQDQLLVLDAYLNRLRADTSFADVFKTLRLNSAQRGDDNGQARVSFDFSAYTSKWKPQ
jgi:hypothetical protein